VLKKSLVSRTSPEFQIANLEVAPKMASTVPVSEVVQVWSLRAIRKPVEGIIQAEKFRVYGQKPQRLGPKRRQRIRVVVDIDCKPVSFVIVGHVAEDVVVNVAEESNLHPLV
jgi:hypothetical protein